MDMPKAPRRTLTCAGMQVKVLLGARKMKITTKFAWYDLWVGGYWDRKTHVLYICPLPTWLIEIHPETPPFS